MEGCRWSLFKKLTDSEIGTILEDKAYQSTTLHPLKTTAFTHGKKNSSGGYDYYIMRIVTTGKEKGLFIGPGEHEVLLARNAKYKVIDKTNYEYKGEGMENITIVTVIRQ